MSPAQFNDHHHAQKETVLAAFTPSPPPSSSSAFPLKISKDSHLIKKTSSSSSTLLSSPSSSSSSSTSSQVNGVANVANKSQPQQQQQQQRHPVIIYTHTPKIIHTHPKDFMALVQKLTGLSRSDDDDDHPNNSNNNNNNSNHHQYHHYPPTSSSSKLDPNVNPDQDYCIGRDDRDDRKKINKGAAGMTMNDDNESTSVVTDDNNGGSSSGTNLGEAQVNSCFVPPPIFDQAPNPCFNGIPYFNPNSSEFLCTDHHHHQPFYSYSEDPSLFFLPNMRSSLSSSTLEGMKEIPDF